jgi:hypothetical protein
MEALHREELPVHGIVGLVQHRAHRRHLGVFQHRLPARFFVLHPVAYTLAVLFAHHRRDVIDKMAESLAQCHHTQAFALATAVQQGMELRAQALAHRGREAHQLVGELGECMTQAKAQAPPRKQRPHTLGRAVKAIAEGALPLVRRLVLQGRPLKRTVGLSQGHRALGLTVAQMPEHPAADDGGQ